MIGKKKNREKKRRRPGKKQREQERMGRETVASKEGKKKEEIGKHNLWEFRVGGKKTEDLWESVKDRKGSAEVEWVKGKVDVTRWEKIWSEKILVSAKIEEREVIGWKNVRKEMKKEKKGVIKLELKNGKDGRKWVKEIEIMSKEG